MDVSHLKRAIYDDDYIEKSKKKLPQSATSLLARIPSTSNCPANDLSIYGPLILAEMSKMDMVKSRSIYHSNLFLTARTAVENFLQKITSLIQMVITPDTEDYISTTHSIQMVEYMKGLPWKIQTISHNIEVVNIPLIRAETTRAAALYENLQRLSSEIGKLDDVLSIRNQSATPGRLARNG
ncbi:unnamed protein product [Auanema sp. JU1783]|nr:unnamed protein product [Auanema sp. JU1783]